MLAESNPYSPLWNKYRPVILQLMSAAVQNGPQQYKLFAHEFRAIGQKEKSGFSFVLEASNGRALNNIKTSTVAKNLLQVLQQSPRASELMGQATYELSMDKHFVFHVTRREVPKDDAPEEIKEDVKIEAQVPA
jgi:hypothetical protein